MSVRLTLTDQPDPAYQQAIGDALNAYNERFAGPGGWRPLAVLVQDGEAVIGGLWGETGRGFLSVKLLVVPETQRRAGLGSRILCMAEDEALRRGCVGAWLSTFSFQARGFYERHGYACFGTIDGYPPGHASHFMQKRF